MSYHALLDSLQIGEPFKSNPLRKKNPKLILKSYWLPSPVSRKGIQTLATRETQDCISLVAARAQRLVKPRITPSDSTEDQITTLNAATEA